MNKQIEEMTNDLYLSSECKHLPEEECDQTTCAHCLAEELYKKGYRKASDVAREIFEELEEFMVDTELYKMPTKSILAEKFAKFKKKYESEGVDDGLE